MTDRAPQWTDEMLQELIDGGSLAPLAKHAKNPWLKVRLRATATKEKMFATYVKAQVYAYRLRDNFRYKTPASREAFLIRHVLPTSTTIAGDIANFYRDDKISAAADDVYARLRDDAEALGELDAELKSLIDQRQNTPLRF